MLETNLALNRVNMHLGTCMGEFSQPTGSLSVTIVRSAVSNHDNDSITIEVPLNGTLGTARLQGYQFEEDIAR